MIMGCTNSSGEYSLVKNAAKAGLPDLFNRLVARGLKPEVIYVSGNWLDVNDAFDLAWARNVL